jgi:hypothetical protein
VEPADGLTSLTDLIDDVTLATFDSAWEWQQVMQVANPSPPASATRFAWSGYTDAAVEGTWLDMGGQTMLSWVAAAAWSAQQPDDTGSSENCAAISTSGLDDAPCTQALLPLCKVRVPRRSTTGIKGMTNAGAMTCLVSAHAVVRGRIVCRS